MVLAVKKFYATGRILPENGFMIKKAELWLALKIAIGGLNYTKMENQFQLLHNVKMKFILIIFLHKIIWENA